LGSRQECRESCTCSLAIPSPLAAYHQSGLPDHIVGTSHSLAFSAFLLRELYHVRSHQVLFSPAIGASSRPGSALSLKRSVPRELFSHPDRAALLRSDFQITLLACLDFFQAAVWITPSLPILYRRSIGLTQSSVNGLSAALARPRNRRSRAGRTSLLVKPRSSPRPQGREKRWLRFWPVSIVLCAKRSLETSQTAPKSSTSRL
jgi:hypothetical protein